MRCVIFVRVSKSSDPTLQGMKWIHGECVQTGERIRQRTWIGLSVGLCVLFGVMITTECRRREWTRIDTDG